MYIIQYSILYYSIVCSIVSPPLPPGVVTAERLSAKIELRQGREPRSRRGRVQARQRPICKRGSVGMADHCYYSC